jgi:hypothetical protein
VKLGTFKIKTRRKSVSAAIFAKSEKLKDATELPPFFIRGIKAGSKEEYWISLALDRIQEASGIGWDYQVSIFGGRSRSGGLVIDFVVYTPGRQTWISPMGKYWHTGKHEDQFAEIDAARKKNATLIAFYTELIPTKEIAYTFIRNKLSL